MKLRSIRLENVRRFIDPVEIKGIGDGLNVLSAPNEYGKSTFFDALHALFFKPRKSWDKEIRSLVPHIGGDPSVVVEIEIPGGIYQIRKRWNKSRNGDVQIVAAGQLVKQADDAEAWIAETLKAPRDGGPAGLLWVRQGLTGLEDDDVAQLARRDLLTSVAGEVEAITGGRRMDAARNRCRNELDRYLTTRGRAKTNGPLKQKMDEVDTLNGACVELVAKSEQLRQQLDRRRLLRQELAPLEDPEEVTGRKTRLAEAEAAHKEASHHAEMLEKVRSDEHTKRVEVRRAEESLASLEKNLSELTEAIGIHRSANEEVRQAVEQFRVVEARMSEAGNTYRLEVARAEIATDTLRKVLLAEQAAATVRRRQELIEKIRLAEDLRQSGEQASVDAGKELSEKVVSELETLDETVRILHKARDIGAVAIAITYMTGRRDGISLDGEPLPDGERIPIPDGARLQIHDIGQLDIHPGQRTDGEALAKAEGELARALEAAGRNSIEAVRASDRRRREAELRIKNTKTDLQSLAPDGIDVLREQLPEILEETASDEDLPTVEEAQREDEAARQALAEALEEYETVRTSHVHAATAVASANATAENAATREARAEVALSGIDDPEAEIIVRRQTFSRHRTELDAAVRQREEAEAEAPDLEAATVALERARSIIGRADEDRQRIRLELGKLDTYIAIQAGEAVDEELADTSARLEAAQDVLNGLEFEVAVLKKLDAALEIARTSARDRYVEPVMKELVPLLRLFWPKAELNFDAETLMPTVLVRAGTEEDFDILSGGTQEQIALLVRLAFARMLAKAGSPAPIILDDAIVYTDDDRIERMFDALTRQANGLQIVVFSCRQKAFRDLGGLRLDIVAETQIPVT